MSAKVTLLGTVGRDPEFKVSQGGMSYAKFSVATRTGKKLQDGSWSPDRWFDVMAFGPLSEQIHGVIHRGSYVEVEGKFDYEEYKKQDGTVGQSFKCLADRIEQKEKPAPKVHTPQQPAQMSDEELLNHPTAWSKGAWPEARDAHDRESQVKAPTKPGSLDDLLNVIPF